MAQQPPRHPTSCVSDSPLSPPSIIGTFAPSAARPGPSAARVKRASSLVHRSPPPILHVELSRPCSLSLFPSLLRQRSLQRHLHLNFFPRAATRALPPLQHLRSLPHPPLVPFVQSQAQSSLKSCPNRAEATSPPPSQ
jgi:hypothetical protein